MPANTAACRPPRARPPATRGWPPERRARQRALIRNWAPWRKTTGPKTEAGKKLSAQNALRHGLYTRKTQDEFRALRSALRRNALTLMIVRAHLNAIRGATRSRQHMADPPEKNSSELIERTDDRKKASSNSRLLRRSPSRSNSLISSLWLGDPPAPSRPFARRACPSGRGEIRSDRARWMRLHIWGRTPNHER